MTPPPTLTTRQQAILRAMGVELWHRRARGVTVALETRVEKPAPRAKPVSVEQPSPVAVPVDAIPSSGEAAAPTMHLECLAAPGVVLLGEFDSAADGRFAQDVLLAIAGPGADVQRTQFRWPQTQTGDVGLLAARSAYLGFIRGQTERAAARCLVLLGAAAVALLDAAMAAQACAVVTAGDAAVLRGDPAGKRALWLAISPYCQR